jgi:hypothetical protein
MVNNYALFGVIELTDSKVDQFTDSMIEDIQDVIKVEYPHIEDFNHGILPPRYKELKDEMKVIIHNYIYENMIVKENALV